jgi:hypothetical protein
VYLDLSAISFIDDSSVRLDLSTALDGLEETILFNFRRLDDVVITLDGSVPFVPSYRAGSIGN